MRVTTEQLNAIKEKYHVSELWSFSKIHTYEVSPYSYYLKYIRHIPEQIHDGIYSESGTAIHDILEKYYNNEIKYEDMLEKYEDNLILFNTADLKYNKTDEEKNAAIANKYEECIKHFLTHHQRIPGKTITEQFVLTKIGNYIFQGYADLISQEDDIITIYDFKTSTKYTGDKVKTECQQLILYTQALMQKGIKLENIRCCWDFLKYTNVSYVQKNGETKVRTLERHDIGKSLASAVKTKLKSAGYDDKESKDLIELLAMSNDINVLPEEIRNQFTFSDCLVYVPLSEELIENLNKELIALLDKVNALAAQTKAMPETNIEEIKKLWWDPDDLLKKNEYFHLNLSGYSLDQHEPFKRYWDRKMKEQQSTQGLLDSLTEETLTTSSDTTTDDLLNFLSNL